jgi:excisionase family DNA binding protein
MTARRAVDDPRRLQDLSRKPLLSIEETAILLGETRSTLYRAVKQPDFPLPVHRIGKRLRIPRRAVERLIAGLPAGTFPSEAAPQKVEFGVSPLRLRSTRT